jgi:type IV secretory pathway TrbD component
LGLRIDYLSPTVYLTDILVVGILGMWGLENITNVKCQMSNVKFKSQILKLLFPFSIFIFLLINSLLAQNPGAALYKFVKIGEFSLLGLYVAKNINFSLNRLIVFSLSGAVVYSSLIAILQFFKQASLGGIFWWLGERTFNVATPGIAKAVVDGQLIMRPYGTFPHPNVLAGFILVSLIFVIAKFSSRSLFNKSSRWMVVSLGIIAMALSFSRSAWLVGVSIGLWLLTTHFLKKLRKHILLLVSCYLLVVIMLATLLSIKLPFSTDEAFFQRVQLIKSASLMIQTNPLIGVGLNNFIVRLPENWSLTGFTYWLQPVHNIYLLVAAETGIVGLVIFGWFLVLTYKKLLITNYQLLITLSAILALGLFDHYWLTLQQTQLLLTIILGLAWAKVS